MTSRLRLVLVLRRRLRPKAVRFYVGFLANLNDAADETDTETIVRVSDQLPLTATRTTLKLILIEPRAKLDQFFAASGGGIQSRACKLPYIPPFD